MIEQVGVDGKMQIRDATQQWFVSYTSGWYDYIIPDDHNIAGIKVHYGDADLNYKIMRIAFTYWKSQSHQVDDQESELVDDQATADPLDETEDQATVDPLDETTPTSTP